MSNVFLNGLIEIDCLPSEEIFTIICLRLPENKLKEKMLVKYSGVNKYTLFQQ